tara:strand:+ start:1887 stop:4250 length:2364 start_codon:yes stop_codon:yes gene_type:complete
MKNDELFEIKKFFFRIRNNWLIFTSSTFICILIALAFNRYSSNIYKVSTTVLFDDQQSFSSNAAEAIYSNDLFQKSPKNLIANKIYELSSYPIIFQTLDDLNFDIEYYLVGNIKNSITYDTPFKVIVVNNKNKLLNRTFKITYVNEKVFNLSNKKLKINKNFLYGKKINLLGSNLKVVKNVDFISNNSEPTACLVKFKSLQKLTKKYQTNLKFAQEQKKSSIVKIDLKCLDEKKGVIFLNKLTENFIKNEINKKNLSSQKTILFIDNQLNNMRDSLENIENKVKVFKQNNGLTEISVTAQNLYDKLNIYEKKILSIKNYNEYLSYLSSYLESMVNLDEIKIPPNELNENNLIRKLINDLIDIQFQKSLLVRSGQIKNPAVLQYERASLQIVSNLKENIILSLNNNKQELREVNEQKILIENEINELPKIEKELLEINRIKSINENIYTFLLRKKSEIDISASSNIADTKILESAVFFNKKPIIPNKNQNILLATFLGFIFPLLFFLFFDLFNDKILSRFDIEKLSSIPIVGIIGRNNNINNLLSKINPKSMIFEGFRAIRSDLSSLLEEMNGKIVLITSSISGEGKTFFAENLAIVFAKTSNKTLLIGADLRKPKLWKDFKLNNNLGLSNYLSGDIKLEEIINNVKINNLDVITSGPVPKDPAEMLHCEKFTSFINLVKNKYDIIILDTPPVGLVADSISMMKFSDVNLFMIRQSYTNKNLLSFSEDLYKKQRLGEMYLVFNDVKEGSGVYGYSYGNYGYGSYNSYQRGYYSIKGSNNNNDYFNEDE